MNFRYFIPEKKNIYIYDIYIYIFLINQSILMNYLMIVYIFGPIFYYSDILKKKIIILSIIRTFIFMNL